MSARGLPVNCWSSWSGYLDRTSRINDKTGFLTMDAMKNCVGRRRAAAGLRQQELAARIGISRQSLSVLEAGHSAPSTAIALRLAQALDCRVEDLFWVDQGRSPIAVEI